MSNKKNHRGMVPGGAMGFTTTNEVGKFVGLWGIFTVNGQRIVAFVQSVDPANKSMQILYPNGSQSFLDVTQISQAQGPFPVMPNIGGGQGGNWGGGQGGNWGGGQGGNWGGGQGGNWGGGQGGNWGGGQGGNWGGGQGGNWGGGQGGNWGGGQGGNWGGGQGGNWGGGQGGNLGNIFFPGNNRSKKSK
ncbi:hypothetical protein FHS18_002187 [Paenibacillus phyllosphaerae]|uniref:Uncharacterized protein n=1 Tax=Paenibacillus phyllosphaerae TaxID=274593 RepID=A0A7W5AWK4_9BACL|nr:hypothetical protein [Paenibacillus phyllosphaerae]MBB3110120.1 hypothetical protein [Paenibacillus phyllosphaerae]